MPAKKTSSTGSDGETPLGLTDGELRFIKAIFDNMTQKPDANWDLVADGLGLKDAKCAKERFRQMSVRHGWGGQAPATASPRKAKAGASTSGDNKVTKKPRTPRKKVKKDSDSEAETKQEVKEEEVKKEVKTEVKTEDNDATMGESDGSAA
ncbi:hypothetical protein AK830_g9348 [Neonectria ditissima]|uniref:Myb-like domain-containing protein n=1 Tax=Neonectria ditissima TaxID=78410 RepID=A0A0P7B984_9HYPO|nr:hypothetical protein AK830_g9348 [Neonectria ditissima]